VKVLRACAILHNYVLNKDKIQLDDEGDEYINDVPVQMGYYPMRLDPNVEEDKIIIDRLHSSVPGQSVVRGAIKRFIQVNEMRCPDYNLAKLCRANDHNRYDCRIGRIGIRSSGSDGHFHFIVLIKYLTIQIG